MEKNTKECIICHRLLSDDYEGDICPHCQEEDLFAYDEDDAVRYILNVLPQELKEKYTHDDIIYVTDVVYDYYDQKGLFDEQAGEEVELDEEDIIAFACKSARKDGVKIEDEDMPFLVRGELDYEESLGVF